MPTTKQKTDFNILDVPKFYKGLSHQDKALTELWSVTDPTVQTKFVKTWRTVTVDPRIDKLVNAVPSPGGRRERSRVAIPLLLKWCDHYRIVDPDHIGYIVGTVSGECAFAPIREGRANRTRQPYLYALQERYWHTGYFGRGYVQLTWRENYLRLGQEIGLGDQLVVNPDKVLEPDIAAHICVVGMFKGLFSVDTRFNPRPRAKLSFYDRPDGSFDFLNARRIVNLTDKASTFASYGEWYSNAIA